MKPTLFVALLSLTAFSMEKARVETRVDEAARRFGVNGQGVVVAILDRGIDWKNNDFRNADGTTRIDSILDFTDDAGANAPNNPFKRGTIYTREQIDAALANGTALAHRDAVGHGTTTTGIAAGNGRNSRDSRFRGVAPKATIVVVKIVAGAAAHDGQPAEASFPNTIAVLTQAMDYAKARATALGLPLVVLPNIGSVSGPMDGTSKYSKAVDAFAGPGIPGVAFINGSSDDGGIANHARATVAQGQSVTLQFDKLDANPLRLEGWYPGADRYDVTIQTPSQTLGPYLSPATNAASDSRNAGGASYFHYGSTVTPYGSVSQRLFLIDFTGPAGKYSVTVRGVTAGGSGPLHAWLNTINGKGAFTSFVDPGYTIWDVASSFNNICPNDYVLRNRWADTQGVVRGIPADRVGRLWEGSGIGPTVDGRVGIDVSAPGNTVFTTLAPLSLYATGAVNLIQEGAGLYTAQNAVSGAAPQVTGIAALMLQINPTLDAGQIKQILQQTARADDFTGAVPNVKWGYGKVDALAAVAAASEMPGAKSYYSVDRNVISIEYAAGDAAPGAQTVKLTPGNGAGVYSIGVNGASWLSASASGGDGEGEFSLQADPTGLAAGDYVGEVRVESTDGGALPQTIAVYLHVRRPGPVIHSIVDAGAFEPGFANGSRIVIRGVGLSRTTRELRESDIVDGKMPTQLDGASVFVFDRDAYPYYVSPTEIRAVTANNPLTNTRFSIVTRLSGQSSNAYVANVLTRNPQFFRVDGLGGRYMDARFASDGSFASGADAVRLPAPGDAVQFLVNGCGATNPVLGSDRVITDRAEVTEPATLTIGGVSAAVSFAGLVGNGVCRVDAVLPNVQAGDAEVILKIGSAVSSDGAFLAVGASSQ